MTDLFDNNCPSLDQIVARDRRRLRVQYIRSKRSRAHILQDVKSVTSSDDTSQDYPKITNDETRKVLRKIRNRESAEASRKRKRDDVTRLQEQMSALQRQVKILKSRLSQYESIETIENMLNDSRIVTNLSKDTLVYTEPAAFRFIFH